MTQFGYVWQNRHTWNLEYILRSEMIGSLACVARFILQHATTRKTLLVAIITCDGYDTLGSRVTHMVSMVVSMVTLKPFKFSR